VLTAYPPLNGDWKTEGVESMLVKPIGTQDLMRQIEALLVRHEDEKHLPRPASTAAASLNREGGRKVS
jgi:hypothetical protein